MRYLLAVAVILTGTLAGCSGEAPSLAGATDKGVSTDTTDAGPLSAFGTVPDPTEGRRKVIENPTVADVMQVGPLPDISLGRADAPVTIVQYASLTCPHCRAFHDRTFPELKRQFIDKGKVRYILREFPIGKQSGQATVALRCAKPEKYFDLYGKFMMQQAAWVSQEVRLDPIFAVAKQVGMTRAEFDACYQNQAMIEGLKWVKERGRTLGIIGTPNFFIDGQLIKKELTLDEIRALVEARLAGAAVASKEANTQR